MSFITELPSIFPDFVTSRNFLLFIITKEYLDFTANNQLVNVHENLFNEEEKIRFYLFLFKSVKDNSEDLYKVLQVEDSVLKKELATLVLERILCLVNNIDELLTYTHILELMNNVISGFHDHDDVVDADRTGRVCKYSVMGVFMKKFCLAFNAMSIEKIISFVDGFKKAMSFYGIIEGSSRELSGSSKMLRDKSIKLKCERLSEDQVMCSMESFSNDIDNIIYGQKNTSDPIKTVKHSIKRFQQQYPNIADTSFLDHFATVKYKNLETFEKEIQHNFASKFLGKEDDNSKAMKSLQISNKDSRKTLQAVNLFSYHKKMSEINLNSSATLLSMGFKDEALLHYNNALFNAKLSKNVDLLDEVRSVGNSLMPINDNPNPTVFSKNSDSLSNKAALGNIRISMLQHLHNKRSSLAKLLEMYFTSVAPQRREITPICLIYLSIMFRSFGFESMANTYMIIAVSQESIRRTENHEHVMVEVIVQLMQYFMSLGHYNMTKRLFEIVKTIGCGIISDNHEIQSSLIQCYFNDCILRLDYNNANICIEKLRHFSLTEYGIRRVQMMFIDRNHVEAERLGDHLISFAIKKRELLVYNHVSLSTGRPTIPTVISDHRTNGVTGQSLEAKEFPTLDDVTSQNWGCRDWAIYECRCRWLMCSQLINRRQMKTGRNHLQELKDLSKKFSFFHFVRLCQLLERVVNKCDQDTTMTIDDFHVSDLSSEEKAKLSMSTRMFMTYRNQMISLKMILRLYLASNDDRHNRKDAVFESDLNQLSEYCHKSGDYIGQAHCLQMRYQYSGLCGDHADQERTQEQLERHIVNKFSNVGDRDFLEYVL